jgi:hypothetical protein
VGRRDHDRPYVPEGLVRQQVRTCATAVDRKRHDIGAVVLNHIPVERETGVLHRDRGGATVVPRRRVGENRRQQGQRLYVPRDDDDPIRVGPDSARSSEILGQRPAQFDATAWISVPVNGCRRGGQRPSQ